MRIALVLALLLSLPAPVAALELRHEPVDGGCLKETTQAETTVHKWMGQLGGPNTKRGWRLLMEAGPHGCNAVATWLGQGAPAAEDSEIAAAVQSLLRSGSAKNVEAAAVALGHPSNEVVAAAAFGLRARLPVLDRPLAELVVGATHRPWEPQVDAPDPRASLLGLLLGRHAEGRVQYVQDGPVSVPEWIDTKVWTADALPDLHREALTVLLETADPGLERAFAELSLAMIEEDHPTAAGLGPLLVPLLQRISSERPTAQTAAQALGRGGFDGVEAAVEAVLTQRNPPYLAPHLLNGFEDRIKAKAVDAAMVTQLERLRAAVPPRSGRRADRLWKRAKKMD